jgi:hypothetical protein
MTGKQTGKQNAFSECFFRITIMAGPLEEAITAAE